MNLEGKIQRDGPYGISYIPVTARFSDTQTCPSSVAELTESKKGWYNMGKVLISIPVVHSKEDMYTTNISLFQNYPIR